MADANARLRITAEDATRAAWDSAANQARLGANKISGYIKGAIAGASLGAAAAALKKTLQESIEYADSIGKGAERTGLAVESFSTLAGAASKADVEINTLTTGLNTMQVGLANTSEESGKLADELKDLGLKASDLKSLNADQQFIKIADALRQVQDPAEKARIRLAFFGSTADEFAGFIEKGADEIERLRGQSNKLTDEQAQNISKLDESFKALGSSGKSLGISLTAALAEPLSAIVRFGTEVATLGRNLSGGLSDIEEIETKLRILREAEGSIPIVFDFLGKINDGKFVMGPKAIEAEAARLQAILDKLKSKQSSGGAPPPINDAVPISDLVLPSLSPAASAGIDADLRRQLDTSLARQRFELEGEDARLRAIERSTGGRAGVNDEARDRLLEQEREYFGELTKTVTEGAERTSEASEASLDQYFARIEQKTAANSDFLRGATEEFGRTVQSSLSDVFFNAGKGADGFADSVLNAFKRILADAAANKVVGLLGGLFGAKKDPGVGGGSGSGILGSVLGSLFGGFRAEGGPVSSGMGYVVGERGPELFMPTQSGTIIPSGSRMSGAVTLNMPVSIDARGATVDAVKMLEARLPGMLKKTSDNAVARVKEEKRRGSL
jgi:hypothetical protein